MTQQVKIRFDLKGEPVSGESVWADAMGENRYRLLNIPFYAFGYAEGDVVLCIEHNEWNQVEGMAQDSGNGTLRLMFSNSDEPDARKVLEELVSVGCTYERASPMLVAVTVPPTLVVPFSQLANYLNGLPDNVLPGWEIGKRPTKSST